MDGHKYSQKDVCYYSEENKGAETRKILPMRNFYIFDVTNSLPTRATTAFVYLRMFAAYIFFRIKFDCQK